MFQSPKDLEIMDNQLSNVFTIVLETTGAKDFSNFKLYKIDVDKERKQIFSKFFYNEIQYGFAIAFEPDLDCDYAINAIKSKFNYSHL